MRRPSLAAALLVSLVFGSFACFPGAGLPLLPPRAPVRGELSPTKGTATPPETSGPLKVVFASPRGATDSANEITLVFSRPLGALGEGAEAPKISLSPAWPGKWSAVGSSAIRFVPEKAFPLATTFRVDVPREMRSAFGDTLAEPYAFWFSTQTPSVIGSEPRGGAADVSVDSKITLFFSQPVAKGEIERAVTIEAGKRLPYSVVELEGDRAVLAPRSPLPRDAEVKVNIWGSIRGV